MAAPVPGSAGPVAVAYAAQTLGMSFAISASSLVYLLVGLMMLAGIRALMKPARSV